PRVARHLADSGLRPGDRVVIWGANRPEYGIALLATLRLGAVLVPLDMNSLVDFAQRVAERTKAGAAIVSKQTLERARSLGIPLHEMELLPDLARNKEPLAKAALAVDALAEVVFTSGTTGEPKGAMLTHGNVLSNALAATKIFPLGPHQRLLSFVPLSHMFEQMAGFFCLLRSLPLHRLGCGRARPRAWRSLARHGCRRPAGLRHDRVLARADLQSPWSQSPWLGRRSASRRRGPDERGRRGAGPRAERLQGLLAERRGDASGVGGWPVPHRRPRHVRRRRLPLAARPDGGHDRPRRRPQGLSRGHRERDRRRPAHPGRIYRDAAGPRDRRRSRAAGPAGPGPRGIPVEGSR